MARTINEFKMKKDRQKYLTFILMVDNYFVVGTFSSVFFFFWPGIVELVEYFQAVRIFLVFSFFTEFFFSDISLCNIFYLQIVSFEFFFTPSKL